MNPEIIEKELLVIGLETTSREGTVADDVHAEGELAGKLNLPATIPNQIDKGKHLVLLWNFQPENDFQAMTAVAVTAVKVLPSVCRAYRFPMSEYAVLPIAGQMPNLVEPWPEIHAWYPKDRDINTTVIRKYNDVQLTGELWLPMEPHLKPVLEARGTDA